MSDMVSPGDLAKIVREHKKPLRAVIDKLREENARLREALKAVEWGAVEVDRDGDSRDCCPGCGHYREDGHAVDCVIALAQSEDGPNQRFTDEEVRHLKTLAVASDPMTREFCERPDILAAQNWARSLYSHSATVEITLEVEGTPLHIANLGPDSFFFHDRELRVSGPCVLDVCIDGKSDKRVVVVRNEGGEEHFFGEDGP